jgi:prophage maintenance system killer protein
MLLGGGLEKPEGALGRPEQHGDYMGADLAQQAAALAQGIVEAHAVQDGNKRVAHVALRAFLATNAHTLTAPKRLRAQWIIDLATGISAEEIAAEIREHLAQLP